MPENKFIFRNTALLFRIGAAFRDIPFTWKAESPDNLINSLTLLSKSKQILWYFPSCWQLIYSVFLYITFYNNLEAYGIAEDLGPAAIHITWICGHSMCGTVRIHHFMSKNDMIHATNKLIEFVTQSIRKDTQFANDFLKRWRLADKLFIVVYPMIGVGGICYGGLVWAFPNNKYNWWQYVLGQNWHDNWGLKFSSFFFELMFIDYIWVMFFLENFLSIFFIDALGTALRVLNKKKVSGEYSIQEMRDEFNRIRILNNLFDRGFGNASGVPAMKVTATITALALFSVGIRTFGRVNPFIIGFFYLAGFTCLIVLGIMIPLSAKVFSKSSEFCFPDFKYKCHGQERVVCKKIVSNFKPFAITMGDFYYIHKNTILTYYNICLLYLINILIVMSSYDAL